MTMGHFAGGAAKATADSTLEWQKLWMMQKDADRNYELANKQFTWQAEESEKNRVWQAQMARAQEAFQLGVLGRQELMEVSKIGLEQMPNMTPQQQMDLTEQMKKMGSPLLGVFQNTVRRGLITNLDQALGIIDTFFKGDPSQPFNAMYVRESARAAATMMGEEEGAAFLADINASIELRQTDVEKWAAHKWDSSVAALDNVRANTGKIEAETAHLGADTARIFQGITFDADKHQFILDHLQHQSNLYELEEVRAALLNTEKSIQNQFLPAMLHAGLRELWAKVQGLENGNELFNRTVDLQVRQMAAATGRSEEDLRHLVATSIARDAIANGELDKLNATIGLLNSQAGQADATAALYGVQADVLGLGMQETRINIATQLVELGRGDLLEAVAGDLFEGMNWTDEQRDSVVASLRATADTRLSNNERQEVAATTLALAEADFARQRADTFETQRLFGNAMAERAADTADRHVDAVFQQIEQDAERIEIAWASQDLQKWIAEKNVDFASADLDLRHLIHEWNVHVGELAQGNIEREMDLKEAAQRFFEIATTRQLGQADAGLALDRARHIWTVASGSEQLRINWVHANAYAASVRQAGETAAAKANAPLSRTDMHEAVRQATTLDVADINRVASTVNETDGRLAAVSAAAAPRLHPQTGKPMVSDGVVDAVADPALVMSEAERLGINPMNYDNDVVAIAHVVTRRLEQDAATARSVAVANTLSYIRAWMGVPGAQYPIAEDLGYSEDDPIWREAFGKLPGMAYSHQAGDEATAYVMTETAGMGLTVGADGFLAPAASTLHDAAIEEFGEDAMARAGLHTPVETYRVMDQTNTAFQGQVSMVNEAAQHYSIFTGGRAFDVRDQAQRDNLDSHLTAKQASVNTLVEMMRGLPRGGGWLGSASTATIQAEGNYVSQVSNSLGIPLQTMAESGLINPNTMQIVNRDEFALFLFRHQQTVADQRTALFVVDSAYRVAGR
jgi:hypothetical protein